MQYQRTPRSGLLHQKAGNVYVMNAYVMHIYIIYNIYHMHTARGKLETPRWLQIFLCFNISVACINRKQVRSRKLHMNLRVNHAANDSILCKGLKATLALDVWEDNEAYLRGRPEIEMRSDPQSDVIAWNWIPWPIIFFECAFSIFHKTYHNYMNIHSCIDIVKYIAIFSISTNVLKYVQRFTYTIQTQSHSSVHLQQLYVLSINYICWTGARFQFAVYNLYAVEYRENIQNKIAFWWLPKEILPIIVEVNQTLHWKVWLIPAIVHHEQQWYGIL